MQPSFVSLLLKMPTPLTATNYLQISSNSNSKMTTLGKTQHSPSFQTNSQTCINTPNHMCETNERERGLLKAWRGCFWRESTLSFPPKPLKHSQKVAFSCSRWACLLTGRLGLLSCKIWRSHPSDRAFWPVSTSGPANWLVRLVTG